VRSGLGPGRNTLAELEVSEVPPAAPRIGDELKHFLDGLKADGTYDPKPLQIRGTIWEIVARIAQSCGLECES
jgi:hypothetical protein